MPHSFGPQKRSRRVGGGFGVAIYLGVGICFGFEIWKSGVRVDVGVGVEVGVGVGGYQWQPLLFCCFLRCVPGPIRVDIMKINKKKLEKKHTHTEKQAMCSIECVPILNVEQFDLKSPVKKTTMKQQARPKKPTINFWGGCCWHWLLKQTASAHNEKYSGIGLDKKINFYF